MSYLNPETTINRQKQAENLVSNHIYSNQTMLVEDALKANFFTHDDIKNLSYYDEDIIENLLSEGYQRSEITPEMLEDVPTENTIYEWWLVSDWLANALERQNQPLLQNDFNTWWGRTCSGQAIYMDSVIQNIALLTS
ncbi:hypothetical protein GVN20_28965 [Runella sp. CRIBMP]|uniref:hypothetical protein n=1 Tax=Runella sp. CRIBMP TaxID=2683261 RepID=UPI001412E77A|nr:hypothetical protein [Runella sp. CRIBMP]NBB23417.1 hypothetical protein [Runella sp. CRIBMP]